MEANAVEISPGTEEDLPQIVEILNYAAAHSNATLATAPTTVEARREWFGRFAATGPYRLVVARQNGRVLGYAASQPYRDMPGFRETVEVSIALAADSRGRGIGTWLYQSLFEALADAPVHVALAGIVLPNEASVALHRKLGFTQVGTFHEYAIKHGEYLSSLWLERLL
jgi:phosphinothricin acetyltransferase